MECGVYVGLGGAQSFWAFLAPWSGMTANMSMGRSKDTDSQAVDTGRRVSGKNTIRRDYLMANPRGERAGQMFIRLQKRFNESMNCLYTERRS